MGLVTLILVSLINYFLRKWFDLFAGVRARFSRVADLRRYPNGIIWIPAIYYSAPRYPPEADPDNDSDSDPETEEKCYYVFLVVTQSRIAARFSSIYSAIEFSSKE